MMVPLDVRFQSMRRDEQVVWEIDAQVAELDELYDSIIGCHVTVYGPAAAKGDQNLYDSQIVLALPCCEIRAKCGSHADANVYVALEKAFTSIREQLLEWLEKRHHVKADCF
ncbi:MAG: hypothetical protein R3C59_00865 [Planctomycetaceae bacterium]